MSIGGVRSPIKSAINLPVVAAWVSPRCPWPQAYRIFRRRLRASDDGQAIGRRRTMAHPSHAALRTQARQIEPRERQQGLGASKIRKRVEAREFGRAADAKPGRQRRRDKLALREDDFPRQRDAGRREGGVVAPFGLDESPIADPLRQSRRPGAGRHHARLEGGAPPVRVQNVRPVEVDRLADDDRGPSAARPIAQGGLRSAGDRRRATMSAIRSRI